MYVRDVNEIQISILDEEMRVNYRLFKYMFYEILTKIYTNIENLIFMKLKN